MMMMMMTDCFPLRNARASKLWAEFELILFALALPTIDQHIDWRNPSTCSMTIFNPPYFRLSCVRIHEDDLFFFFFLSLSLKPSPRSCRKNRRQPVRSIHLYDFLRAETSEFDNLLILTCLFRSCLHSLSIFSFFS
jgi:hypothetical protein